VVASVEVAAAPSPQFGPHQEVVQDLPTSVFRAVPARVPARRVAMAAVAAVPMKPVAAPAKGSFFVQIGAYRSVAIAHDKWGGIARNFAGQMPHGMNVTSKAGTFYRVSVGGFSRAQADAMCSSYRARGGNCFVRAGAGEKPATWVKTR